MSLNGFVFNLSVISSFCCSFETIKSDSTALNELYYRHEELTNFKRSIASTLGVTGEKNYFANIYFETFFIYRKFEIS